MHLWRKRVYALANDHTINGMVASTELQLLLRDSKRKKDL